MGKFTAQWESGWHWYDRPYYKYSPNNANMRNAAWILPLQAKKPHRPAAAVSTHRVVKVSGSVYSFKKVGDSGTFYRMRKTH